MTGTAGVDPGPAWRSPATAASPPPNMPGQSVTPSPAGNRWAINEIKRMQALIVGLQSRIGELSELPGVSEAMSPAPSGGISVPASPATEVKADRHTKVMGIGAPTAVSLAPTPRKRSFPRDDSLATGSAPRGRVALEPHNAQTGVFASYGGLARFVSRNSRGPHVNPEPDRNVLIYSSKRNDAKIAGMPSNMFAPGLNSILLSDVSPELRREILRSNVQLTLNGEVSLECPILEVPSYTGVSELGLKAEVLRQSSVGPRDILPSDVLIRISLCTGPLGKQGQCTRSGCTGTVIEPCKHIITQTARRAASFGGSNCTCTCTCPNGTKLVIVGRNGKDRLPVMSTRGTFQMRSGDAKTVNVKTSQSRRRMKQRTKATTDSQRTRSLHPAEPKTVAANSAEHRFALPAASTLPQARPDAANANVGARLAKRPHVIHEMPDPRGENVANSGQQMQSMPQHDLAMPPMSSSALNSGKSVPVARSIPAANLPAQQSMHSITSDAADDAAMVLGLGKLLGAGRHNMSTMSNWQTSPLKDEARGHLENSVVKTTVFDM